MAEVPEQVELVEKKVNVTAPVSAPKVPPLVVAVSCTVAPICAVTMVPCAELWIAVVNVGVCLVKVLLKVQVTCALAVNANVMVMVALEPDGFGVQVLVPVLFTQVIPLLFSVQDAGNAPSVKLKTSPPARLLNVIALQGGVMLVPVQVETPLAFRVKPAIPFVAV